MAYVREGLRDFSISRAAVDWGIRVPQDPQHTVYVWFDALIGGSAAGRHAYFIHRGCLLANVPYSLTRLLPPSFIRIVHSCVPVCCLWSTVS